ncbi:hypothetical protein M6B38_267055 [Iris pallida]|uniref:Uncharacterized protein n=1 Tax=Iris pallida TaxID=29817 RepID=A0AAX6I924_IRIPA|nr:hypothetical protein M6B38_267010 [Iris pallida]KAJ6849829.1 hypothetical protein M6B38_267055 [Iris pallida]
MYITSSSKNENVRLILVRLLYNLFFILIPCYFYYRSSPTNISLLVGPSPPLLVMLKSFHLLCDGPQM